MWDWGAWSLVTHSWPSCSLGIFFPHGKCHCLFLTSCLPTPQATLQLSLPQLFVKSSCLTGGAFPGIGDLVSSGWNLTIRKSPLDRVGLCSSDIHQGTTMQSRQREAWLKALFSCLNMRAPDRTCALLWVFSSTQSSEKSQVLKSPSSPNWGDTKPQDSKAGLGEPQASKTQGPTYFGDCTQHLTCLNMSHYFSKSENWGLEGVNRFSN